jgi:hypothetical protein
MVVAPEGWPGKKYRDRYCYEHHLVWWRSTGELIGDDEILHHKNGNKRDNRLENLKKVLRAAHTAKHNRIRGRAAVVLRCFWCGKKFEKRACEYEWARKRQSMFFCCRSHQVLQQQKDLRENRAETKR